jgi:hypothetical protein
VIEKVSPIKRPCQEKTLLHGKNIIFFLQGTHFAPGKSLFYPFPCALIFNCFRVAVFFNFSPIYQNEK